MSTAAAAGAHLRKAREFLDAAEVDAELDLSNAAASNAVTSGINSKDAICLALTGATKKSDDHANAAAELRRAGSVSGGVSTAQLASTLGRLLRLKNKSQYQPTDVARSDALSAVDWARTLLSAAESIAAG